MIKGCNPFYKLVLPLDHSLLSVDYLPVSYEDVLNFSVVQVLQLLMKSLAQARDLLEQYFTAIRPSSSAIITP